MTPEILPIQIGQHLILLALLYEQLKDVDFPLVLELSIVERPHVEWHLGIFHSYFSFLYCFLYFG